MNYEGTKIINLQINYKVIKVVNLNKSLINNEL